MAADVSIAPTSGKPQTPSYNRISKFSTKYLSIRNRNAAGAISILLHGMCVYR